MQQYFKLDILVPLAAIIATLAWGIANVYAEEVKAHPDDMQHVASLFSKLDENGDGYITVEEAVGKIPPEVFSKADTNHDGKLSLAEFKAAKLDRNS
ncbi:MAG TPA: EF-hand domain-containing protein [Parasulfuritortus sp.]